MNTVYNVYCLLSVRLERHAHYINLEEQIVHYKSHDF